MLMLNLYHVVNFMALTKRLGKLPNTVDNQGVSTNAPDILRHLQTTLICGRALEITCRGYCPEGLTNFVMIDSQNLLETAFEEIECLENKFITLEIQFYNEVSDILC